MLKILAVIVKELLLLSRDRTGLLMLFIMPALLVVVITLVQVNVMELTGQSKTTLLFLDLDGGAIGTSLKNHLGRTTLEIVEFQAEENDRAAFEHQVADGEYRVGIIIEPGSSQAMERLKDSLYSAKTESDFEPLVPVGVTVRFDPGLMPGFKKGLAAQLQNALQSMATEWKVEALAIKVRSLAASANLPEQMVQAMLDDLQHGLGRELIRLDESDDKEVDQAVIFDPVQQNVAAWALFGMFFTALPIAGGLLEERKSGMWQRLGTLPVSGLQLFSGKVAAFLLVCSCQFVLICLIGALFFPVIGLPPFTIAPHPGGTLLVMLAAGLAVCALGIFLGLACTSYEQAFMAGAISVVAAAAIGGVMVPVYAMPLPMQDLSIISPLNWGLTAFQDLLVRGNPLSSTAGNITRLTLFSLAAVLSAWGLARLRHSSF